MAKKRSKSARTTPKSGAASPAATAFVNLINSLTYKRSTTTSPLSNLTFWAGAGFSKAWEPKSPTGNELFTFDSGDLTAELESSFVNILFGDYTGSHFTPNDVRQIVYFLDMYEKYADVRSRYVDAQNIQILRTKLRSAVLNNFEKICTLNYFDDSTNKFPPPATTDQNIIGKFFYHLSRQVNGSTGIAEGLRYHFITTNYDFVIETILDNLSAPDDSLFLYTYRGFTPESIMGKPNIEPVHDHWLVQHLIKLNGGFEIIRPSPNAYVLDYSERMVADIKRQPPILMLPSREQDYSDPYFKTIFPKAVRLLQETNVLVIVGYSLPPDDALIRFIMRQFAEQAEDALLKHIFYIDFLDEKTKLERLYEVFPYMGLNIPKIYLYQGGFAEFAGECVSIWGIC